jgi:hypothetical protein
VAIASRCRGIKAGFASRKKTPLNYMLATQCTSTTKGTKVLEGYISGIKKKPVREDTNRCMRVPSLTKESSRKIYQFVRVMNFKNG